MSPIFIFVENAERSDCLWPLHDSIPMHISKGKTIARSLGDRTNYAKNPDKTEKGRLVTGYQCDADR